MGLCLCTHCWKTSHKTKEEVKQEDEKHISKIYDSETVPYHSLVDCAKSRKSSSMIAKSVESPVAPVKYRSLGVIWESWRSEKSDDVVAKSWPVNPHLKNLLKTGEKPGDFSDKSHLNPPFSPGYSTKKVRGKESPAKHLKTRSAPRTIVTRSQKNSLSFVRETQTPISDWGDMYEGSTPIQSASGSGIFLRGLSSSFSDQEIAGDNCSLDFASSGTKNITLLPGNVMGMLLVKKDFRIQRRIQSLNLN